MKWLSIARTLPWTLTGLAVMIATIMTVYRPDAAAPSGESRELHISGIGDFRLMERSGRLLGSDVFAGKVWVAEFFFSSCTTICPIQQRQMQRVQLAFAGHPDFRIAAFTVDPVTDTAPALAKYAKRWKADENQWLFFTGSKRMIYELARESFMVGVESRPSSDPGGTDDFIHSDRFSLVDRSGELVGSYHGTDPKEVDQLIANARKLLKEPKP